MDSRIYMTVGTGESSFEISERLTRSNLSGVPSRLDYRGTAFADGVVRLALGWFNSPGVGGPT
jgi:hypothetical protein